MLYPFFGLSILWVFFAGFLIDVDHYIYYVLKFKDLNLKKSYKYFADYIKKKHFKDVLFIFHTIEFFVLLIILSFYSKLMFLFLISTILHQILDLFDFYRYNFWDARAFSLILWLKRNIF